MQDTGGWRASAGPRAPTNRVRRCVSRPRPAARLTAQCWGLGCRWLTSSSGPRRSGPATMPSAAYRMWTLGRTAPRTAKRQPGPAQRPSYLAPKARRRRRLSQRSGTGSTGRGWPVTNEVRRQFGREAREYAARQTTTAVPVATRRRSRIAALSAGLLRPRVDGNRQRPTATGPDGGAGSRRR